MFKIFFYPCVSLRIGLELEWSTKRICLKTTQYKSRYIDHIPHNKSESFVFKKLLTFSFFIFYYFTFDIINQSINHIKIFGGKIIKDTNKS